MLGHEESVRLYGPWRSRTPRDAAQLFDGFPGRWWIAGGWAIEAFTDVPRPHGDIDPSIPRSDAGALYSHLRQRLDVWQADEGALRPMLDQTQPLSDTCENLWLRPNGAAPWEYDVILMHASSATWTYKRDARIVRPLEDIVWRRDDIPYLRPEVQLLHKAPGLRPQDQADFDASVRLLDGESRTWLRVALNTAHPGHPWVAHL